MKLHKSVQYARRSQGSSAIGVPIKKVKQSHVGKVKPSSLSRAMPNNGGKMIGAAKSTYSKPSRRK